MYTWPSFLFEHAEITVTYLQLYWFGKYAQSSCFMAFSVCLSTAGIWAKHGVRDDWCSTIFTSYHESTNSTGYPSQIGNSFFPGNALVLVNLDLIVQKILYWITMRMHRYWPPSSTELC